MDSIQLGYDPFLKTAVQLILPQYMNQDILMPAGTHITRTYSQNVEQHKHPSNRTQQLSHQTPSAHPSLPITPSAIEISCCRHDDVVLTR